MKVINFTSRFTTGALLKVKKKYSNSSITINVGDIGVVDKITIESFPGMLLFDLRIVHATFGSGKIAMEEGIAKGYFEII